MSVRHRFGHEFDCDEGEVDIEDLTNRAYRASGCGHSLVYVASCSGGFCIAPIIVRDSADTGSATARSSDAPEWPSSSVREMVAAIHERVAGCFDPSHLPARIHVVIGSEGTITDFAMVSLAVRDEVVCARAAFAGVHLAGVYGARGVTIAFRAASTGDETSAPDWEGGGVATATVDGTAAVRAAIDQRAAAALACTDGQAFAVVATWDADGAVTIALRGDRHGTAEEACIASALATVRAPASSPAGSVLHSVAPSP